MSASNRPFGPQLDFTLDRRAGIPVYRQIAAELRRRILSGDLRSGTRLPPERRLAEALGVNRTTVVNAYDELAAEGLVSGHVGRGTAVVYRAGDFGSGPEAPMDWGHLFAAPAAGATLSLQEAMRPAPERGTPAASGESETDGSGTGQDGPISFARAEPPPDLYPMAEVLNLIADLLAEMGGEALRLSPTEGILPLRSALADRMAESGAAVSADNVLVTAGAQQAIDLLARLFVSPGDEVAVETPTYFGALEAFRAQGARLVGIPVDGDGMRLDVLEQVLAHRPLKLVFVSPNFSNPSGTLIPLERRRRLLAATRRHQVAVVEDDVYGEIYFGDRPPPPLLSLEPADHVIHVGSLSKTLFPGLRVGWVAAAPGIVERLAALKQAADLHTGTLNQWIAWRALTTGLVDRHARRMRPYYQERRDMLLSALARHCAPYLAAAAPNGGMSLWCRLGDGLRADHLLVAASRMGVDFVPGDAFSTDGRGGSHLRLAFGLVTPETADEGARRLAGAIDWLRRQRRGGDIHRTMPVV